MRRARLLIVPAGTVTMALVWWRFVALSSSGPFWVYLLSLLLSPLFAACSGGFVTGLLSRSARRLNAVLSAAFGTAFGFGRAVWVWYPFLVVDDRAARADNIGTFSFWVLGLASLLPLAILASLLGSRLGSRLTGATARRPSRG